MCGRRTKKATTTTLAESVKNGDTTLFYEYDELGNISAIYEQKTANSAKELVVR